MRQQPLYSTTVNHDTTNAKGKRKGKPRSDAILIEQNGGRSFAEVLQNFATTPNENTLESTSNPSGGLDPAIYSLSLGRIPTRITRSGKSRVFYARMKCSNTCPDPIWIGAPRIIIIIVATVPEKTRAHPDISDTFAIWTRDVVNLRVRFLVEDMASFEVVVRK